MLKHASRRFTDTMVSPYTPGNQKGRRFGKTVRGWHLSSRQELAGEDIEPVSMMKHTLIWDGSLNGIPIIGPNLDEDVFYLTVEIEPRWRKRNRLRLPTRRKEPRRKLQNRKEWLRPHFFLCPFEDYSCVHAVLLLPPPH